jgi:endonuclease-8
MPEGPSIVILKEQVQALHVTGRKLQTVTGNSKIDQSRLLQEKVTAFDSWGKHFLVCFETFVLRVHFLLFGSYTINAPKENAPIRLALVFSKTKALYLYACSIKILEGQPDDHYDRNVDVMSPQWDEKAALQKLRQHPTMLACDAILSQDIFAGAGNIFKNEVLYRTKIHPLSQIGAIPLSRLKLMVKDVHTYAFLFLEWKKQYVLRQHWEVHSKKECPRHHIPLSRGHLGQTNRRSFFCEKCQKKYLL